jgi:hypothetical protein
MATPKNGELFPPFADPFFMPFYYASLSSLKIYFTVDAGALEPFLKGTTLKVAGFKDGIGQGVVSVEFQNYTGHGGTLLETVNEVEFNILAYPDSYASRVPLMPLLEFVKGMDQTKTIGGFRVYVPADNQFAVDAGRKIFGEPKFFTTFHYTLPSLNLPVQKKWEYTVHDPDYTPPPFGAKYAPRREDVIYTITADLTSVPAEPDGNPSSIVLYSMYPELPKGGLAGTGGYGKAYRLIGSLWNIFDVDSVYRLDGAGREKVRVELGKSKHPMRADMEKVLGSATPVIVQVYQSDPVAVENRAYYVDAKPVAP